VFDCSKGQERRLIIFWRDREKAKEPGFIEVPPFPAVPEDDMTSQVSHFS